MRPSFLLVGAQRAGSTSLHSWLTQHPRVAAPTKKEVHFFDLHYSRGVAWYLDHFERERQSGAKITGESSPYYLFHPHAPARARELLPDARLLVLLRDPVKRAWSHYLHETRMERESRSFRDAIEAELRDLPGEVDRLIRDPAGYSELHHRFSYAHRGIYADQLERWFEAFPRENILILESRALFRTPDVVLSEVLELLDLPPWSPPDFRSHGTRRHREMDPSDGAWLREFFQPHDERLAALLGRSPSWMDR